jgi:ABC-type antimicrobial peptide transport system permease subunit
VVVGVVADGHPTSLETESPLMVYVPYWSMNEGKSVLMLRTGADPTALAAEVRTVIRSIDPEVAIVSIGPLQQVVDKAVAVRRYQMWLFSAFGVVALVIATLGVYATTAYGVSRRRREMNLRVALGARASQVFALILRQSAAPLATGVLAGAAGALAAGTVISGFLFQVQPSDPLVIATVVLVVSAIGLLATTAAAKQGLNIDPAAALRSE